ALLQRPGRRRVADQAAQGGLCPWQHSHPVLLRQRDLLPPAPARVQSGQLVQAPLPASRVPARHPADAAAADPADAGPAPSIRQSSPSASAGQRSPGSGLEVRAPADPATQVLTAPVFTPDSGLKQSTSTPQPMTTSPNR